MKIKNLAIIILMITFLIILGTKVYATTGIITEKTVKLRKAPDSKTVLDYVYKDDKVEILELEDGWYKVKATTELGKVTGYISEEEVDVENETSSNITQEQPEEPKEVEKNPTEIVETPIEEVNTTNTQMANNIEVNKQYTLQKEISVKILPLINSIEKTKITGNITVIEIINDWAKIENDVETGWIRKNSLKNSVNMTEQVVPEQDVEEQPQQKDEEMPAETKPEEQPKQEEPQESEESKLNKIGYVSTEGLRVRKGPSTDSEELDSLSKNDQVQIIGQEGKWYKIDLNGKIGYVSAKYISDTKIVEVTTRSGSTLKEENENKPEEVVSEPKVEEPKKEETKVEEKTVESNSNVTGAAVVEYAKKYLGYKYVSGGTSPSKGFDCSGFTQYVYKNFGISLNRTSSAQKNNGVAVSKDDLQPGDLVLFNNDANTKIGHVGIYIGDGNFIHASNPSDGVKITTLTSGYYHKRYVGARRVI